MKPLTEKQEKIFKYINDFIEDSGYPPTLREIGEHFGIVSTNGVNDHLLALEKKGFIKRDKDKSRAIEIVGLREKSQRASIRSIPVLGSIAAGSPIVAEQNVETYLNVDQAVFSRKDSFAVKVKGTSMIGDGILDGDYAVMVNDRVPNEKDIYAVLIEDEVTLKRVRRKKDGIELVASNPEMKNIVIAPAEGKNISIIGRMVGLLRIN